MNCQAVHTFGRFHDRFRNSRVRVHGATQFVGCRFELHRHASLGNQLCRMWANDVHTKNLVILRFAYNLYKPFFLSENA